MAVSARDLAVARELADEVRALEYRRQTWRKVTSILNRFGVYRLTSGVRERLTEALLAAGIDLEPSLLEVDRYSTVRLFLVDEDDGRAMQAVPDDGVLTVSHWQPSRLPVEAALSDPPGGDVVVWVDVDGATADAHALQGALQAALGDAVTSEIVVDLIGRDEIPQVRQISGVRIVSAFSVTAVESEADPENDSVTKAGDLVFQPVEFVVGPRWLLNSCWQGDKPVRAENLSENQPVRADDLLENVTLRWRTGGFHSPGDLALLILRELAGTYADARRQLYSWLESWELDFTRRHEDTEVETLTSLRQLIAEFRKQLAPLQRSDLIGNPQRIWFPGVTDPEEAGIVLMTSSIDHFGTYGR